MTVSDIRFSPRSDMHPDDIGLVEQHKNLIEKNQYSDACKLLDKNNYQKGFRASLFHSLEEKIRAIQVYLLNKYVAEPDELYSVTEPDSSQMEGKTYWIQLY